MAQAETIPEVITEEAINVLEVRTEQIPEIAMAPETGVSYTKADGTVEHAKNFEEARALCPVLGKMSLEMASLMYELTAIGKTVLDEDKEAPAKRAESTKANTDTTTSPDSLPNDRLTEQRAVMEGSITRHINERIFREAIEGGDEIKGKSPNLKGTPETSSADIKQPEKKVTKEVKIQAPKVAIKVALPAPSPNNNPKKLTIQRSPEQRPVIKTKKNLEPAIPNLQPAIEILTSKLPELNEPISFDLQPITHESVGAELGEIAGESEVESDVEIQETMATFSESPYVPEIELFTFEEEVSEADHPVETHAELINFAEMLLNYSPQIETDEEIDQILEPNDTIFTGVSNTEQITLDQQPQIIITVAEKVLAATPENAVLATTIIKQIVQLKEEIELITMDDAEQLEQSEQKMIDLVIELLDVLQIEASEEEIKVLMSALQISRQADSAVNHSVQTNLEHDGMREIKLTHGTFKGIFAEEKAYLKQMLGRLMFKYTIRSTPIEI